MVNIEQIKAIHSKLEIQNSILHLIGDVEGNDLEEIVKIWDGKIYVDKLIGTYHHSCNIPIKIGRDNGTVTGNLSNANICYKSKKKLRKAKRLLFKLLNWE